MAIFNSYVKLPEGKLKTFHIRKHMALPGLPGPCRGDQLCWRGGSRRIGGGVFGPGILVKHWMFQERCGGFCEHLVDFIWFYEHVYSGFYEYVVDVWWCVVYFEQSLCWPNRYWITETNGSKWILMDVPWIYRTISCASDTSLIFHGYSMDWNSQDGTQFLDISGHREMWGQLDPPDGIPTVLGLQFIEWLLSSIRR